jgi:hypothetical protein
MDQYSLPAFSHCGMMSFSSRQESVANGAGSPPTQTWHSGIGMGQGGRFNNEWLAIKAAEKPLNPYTHT